MKFITSNNSKLFQFLWKAPLFAVLFLFNCQLFANTCEKLLFDTSDNTNFEIVSRNIFGVQNLKVHTFKETTHKHGYSVEKYLKRPRESMFITFESNNGLGHVSIWYNGVNIHSIGEPFINMKRNGHPTEFIHEGISIDITNILPPNIKSSSETLLLSFNNIARVNENCVSALSEFLIKFNLSNTLGLNNRLILKPTELLQTILFKINSEPNIESSIYIYELGTTITLLAKELKKIEDEFQSLKSNRDLISTLNDKNTLLNQPATVQNSINKNPSQKPNDDNQIDPDFYGNDNEGDNEADDWLGI